MWGTDPGSTPPPACARPSLAPLLPWRGSAKGLLKRDTDREPTLPSLFEPFVRVHPRARGNRLLTIVERFPWANVATRHQAVTRDKPHRACIDAVGVATHFLGANR
jgi:hypothetical protein